MGLIEDIDLFPVNIRLAFNREISLKNKLGGFYTIFVVLLTMIYAKIIIFEPLKASSSTSVNTVDAFEVDEGSSVGSTSSQTEIINGVEFEGTHEVKKYTNYIKNFAYDTSDYKPHQEGFQFAFFLPANYNSSLYQYEMYYGTVEDNHHNYDLVKSRL